LILNEQKIADRSSRMDLRRNEDGSLDVYCGPKAPAGFEKNWIPTVPGKNWFCVLPVLRTDRDLLRSVLAVAGFRRGLVRRSFTERQDIRDG
jgi:hypothetical protein